MVGVAYGEAGQALVLTSSKVLSLLQEGLDDFRLWPFGFNWRPEFTRDFTVTRIQGQRTNSIPAEVGKGRLMVTCGHIMVHQGLGQFRARKKFTLEFGGTLVPLGSKGPLDFWVPGPFGLKVGTRSLWVHGRDWKTQGGPLWDSQG